MVSALLLPRLLDRWSDRALMIPAAVALGFILLGFAGAVFGLQPSQRSGSAATAPGGLWPALLIAWTLLGIGYSAVMTPGGRLLRRSANAADRPAVFAAQFALSHAGWLITYPLAGWLGLTIGIPATLGVFGLLTLIGPALAKILWPVDDPKALAHQHPELPLDHSHVRGHSGMHAHAFVIDDLHRRWP